MTRPRRVTSVPADAAQSAQEAPDAMCGASDAARGTTDAGRGISIHLPLPPKECHPNWTGKLRDRIRAKREAREWAYYATIEKIAETPGVRSRFQRRRVRATAAFTFAVRRTRDDDNLMASLKGFRDSIAATLGIDDNVWTWDGPPTVAIGPHEGVVITIWEMED